MADAPFILPLAECHDVALVGGKALNLAHLLSAGFPAPGGFVVTTQAFRRAAGRTEGIPPEVSAEIVRAYREMGAPVVAVRSSATAEDMASASMAGQYETFLGIAGETQLLDAVGRCWAALDTPRTRAYLAEHGIDPAGVAMAVVVQRLVPADVAGVLFTANPHTGSREEMLLEASWGLGEAVVSGAAQPDTLILDRATGAVKQSVIGDKSVCIDAASHEPRPVAEERRKAACLTTRQVHDLWRLGLRVMEHFGAAQDIEWAIAGGELFLLQSRAVTTLEMAEAYEQRLCRTRDQIREWKRAGSGDWVRHNIAETLPHPTPLTWSVIRRFMSGDGGFGAMYRSVGFEPSPVVRREGFLDLIAGRIYMDLARGPEMFFEGFPFRYDLEHLRGNPDAAQGPPTVPAGSLPARVRVARRLRSINARLEALATDCDRRLDGEIIPAFAAWVRREKARDLARLSATEWHALWLAREAKVMDEFGPASLLPSLIGAMALERLRAFVDEHFWDDDPAELANLLAAGGPPDETLRSSQALTDVVAGRRSVADWIASYGHRAPDEFDLATPRWRERPETVVAMAARLAGAVGPLQRHEERVQASARRADELAAQLPPGWRGEFRDHVTLARRYLRFREDGKFYLMMGYDLLRDLALEAGRRLDIGEDVFLLTPEELRDALQSGFAPLHLVEQRRMIRTAEGRIVLPDLITEADIDSLGRPPPVEGEGCRSAFPISAGVCTGPVRIVCTPEDAGDLGSGYVLVCPSTDPNWTPLFVNAAGLVMERGGTLSHGAVVAREMGIPAVVLPGAMRFLHDGQMVTVDGHRGAVVPAGVAESAPAVADPADVRIDHALVPPVPGAKERLGARLRNAFLLVWAAYFVAAFALPQGYVYRPSIQALDAVLWPLAAWLGKHAVVAIVAAALALLTTAGQWLLTDNRRLQVAKQRAALLRKQMANLPRHSPRWNALAALAAPVQMRITLATFVPLAVLLGPMVMSVAWMPERIDPAAWNPRPGAVAHVTAAVCGEFLAPVTLTHDAELALDATTPAAQVLPPIRATLEDLLGKWREASDLSTKPWEVERVATLTREETPADLAEFLKGEIPPQNLVWTLHTPDDRSGRFTVALAHEGAAPLRVHIVLGDRYPPEFRADLGDGKGPVQVMRPADGVSPIRMVKVVYVEPKTQGGRAFWTPMAALGWPWDAGWLLLYIVVYLPAMLLCRWTLRLA
jgi:phosphohistidine swiveling domain-containing protein/uncharacterized membrane protein (DUF106 family)